MAGGGIKINNIKVSGGADGATFIPYVDDEGNLSWSNNKGYTNPPTVNIKGENGVDGKDGKTGTKIISQTFQGTDANGGNVYLQTFDDGTTATFVAPKGPQGEQGPQGPTGPQGQEGESIYSVNNNAIISENPNFDEEYTINTSIIAIWDEDRPVNAGDAVIDGLGNAYIIYRVAPGGLQAKVYWTGTNIKGKDGEGIPSNMSQNDNKTIIVDGSVVNGNWNATFIVQQGGKQRPICTQYVNHTGAKAEMVATANSAKFKFVNGTTDPQSYMEVFEDRINFSKPITVQGNPIGGGSSGGSGSNIYYFAAPKDKGTIGYPIWVLPPLDGVKKIELVRYSWAGTSTSGFGGYPYYTKTDTNKILYEDGVWNLVQNQYISGFYLDFTFDDNSGSVSDSLFFITDSYGLIELSNYTSSSMGSGAIWERGLIPSDEFDYDSIELVFKITMN